MNKQIEYHITKAREIALSEIEKIARKILREHKNLDYFIMATGTYYFVDKKGNHVETHADVYINGNYGWEPTFKYMEPLINIFTEYDDMLKLSGEPMKFNETENYYLSAG